LLSQQLTCLQDDVQQCCHAVMSAVAALCHVHQHNTIAITQFKVVQGHRRRYQSKASMQLPISD